MTQKRIRHTAVRSAVQNAGVGPILDSLERRMLFSTINWTNKGSAGSDSDGFTANYGANATIARQNVQRAVDDWAAAIVNFNHSGGGNTFNVQISAASIGGRGVTSNITQVGGKPNGASILLDDNGGGGGWFFDSVVGTAQLPDDSEFRTPISPYASDDVLTPGNDFYRTAVHELAHAMGISRTSGLLINNFLANVADDPNSSDSADRLFSFNVGGGAVEAAFTSEGGLHSYEGPSVLGLPIHPNDLINSGRTVPTGLNRRQLISDFLLTTLQQAYGYTILPVSQLNSFSTNLNTTTNLVTINGDLNPSGNDGDNISVTPVGSSTRFFVNGRFETISNTEFIAVQINAGDAGDTINVDALPSTGPATIFGGAGDDVIIFAGSSSNLDNVAASVLFDGGAGADTVLFEDDGSTNSFAYTVGLGGTGIDFSRPNCGLVRMIATQTHTINGAGGGNTFDIRSTIPGTTWTLNGFNGNDVFNIGVPGGNAELVDGAITINGMVGSDTFNYHDSTATGNPTYSLSPTQLTRTGNGTVTYATVEAVNVNAATANAVTFDDQTDAGNDRYTISGTQIVKTAGVVTEAVFNYAGASSVSLLANQGSNDIFVNSIPAGMQLNINAGGGGFNAVRVGNGNVGANLLGTLTINAGTPGASNGVVFDNSLDTTASTQTLNGGVFTDGLAHTVTSADSIAILNGSGGGTLDLNRVTILVSVVCTSAMPVNIAAGNWQSNILATTFIDTLGNVTIDDRLDSGNDTYTIESLVFRKTNPGTAFISIAPSAAAVVLQANEADNQIQVSLSDSGTSVRVRANGGNDHVQVVDTQRILTPVSVDIDTGAERASAVEPFGDYVTVNSDNDTVTGTARLVADDVIRRLTVNANGTFVVPTGVTAQIGELIIPGGTINLAGGTLLGKAGGPTLATLKTLATRGFNGGAWNGTNAGGAINSSLAAASAQSDGVGYGLGSEITPTSSGAFAIATGDVLVRHTLNGDADLNGIVNIGDFARLAANFNGTNKVWTTGDSNYDNTANISDFAPLAANFNQSSPRNLQPAAHASFFGSTRIGSPSPLGMSQFLKDLEAQDVSTL